MHYTDVRTHLSNVTIHYVDVRSYLSNVRLHYVDVRSHLSNVIVHYVDVIVHYEIKSQNVKKKILLFTFNFVIIFNLNYSQTQI